MFPGEDDFGITPLEAQACNTPVIAYASGGALETVTNQTGIFFSEQKEEALCDAVQEMERRWKNFSPESFSNQTKLFRRENYKEKMAATIQNGYMSGRDEKKRILNYSCGFSISLIMLVLSGPYIKQTAQRIF